ncbi:MAG: NADH-quinone oxidoreductase subunit J [Anaerolineae bacterium]|nr:NADH-quinone oxidoreductase subunit J [Anaerolineae bacterium]
MIVSLAFVLLALLAAVGAVGLLVLRRVDHCVWAFGITCAALGGLYLLLNNPLAAAMQVVSLFVIGSLLAVGLRMTQAAGASRAIGWAVPVGLALMVLAGWATLAGRIGAPLVTAIPIWAAREDRVLALGQELLRDYVILFELLGFFLLTCLAGFAYVRRSSRSIEGES